MTGRSNLHALLWWAACGVLLLAVTHLAGVARAVTPCDADIKKFCEAVPVGSGRVQACLKEHTKELSPECAAWYESLQRTTGDIAATCRQDIARFCRDVSPGKGKITDCLEEHRSDLSPPCSDQLHKAPKPN
jgi:hypothetical protein